MSNAHFPKPRRPNHDVPEEIVPGAMPVEPDEGPVPLFIPDEPDHDREIDPGAARDLPARHGRRRVEVA